MCVKLHKSGLCPEVVSSLSDQVKCPTVLSQWTASVLNLPEAPRVRNLRRSWRGHPPPDPVTSEAFEEGGGGSHVFDQMYI